MSGWRKQMRRGAQLVAVLLITAALTEVAFRVLHRVSPVFIFPSAGYNRFRPPPHAPIHGFTLNSQGFKDTEHSEEKPEGGLRILGIGDSFVYGVVPYEHLFLTVLEERLRREHGDIEVVKMGIPRVGVADYFAILVNEGLRFEPDVVVVHFFIGNDFHVHHYTEEAPSSYLLAFLRYVFRILPQVEGEAPGRRAYRDTAPTLKQQVHMRQLRKKLPQLRAGDPRALPDFATVVEYLEKIAVLCDDRGLELLVVLIPDEMQVDTELFGRLLATMPERSAADFDLAGPNRRLRRELERLGVRSLDLLPVLRAEQALQPVYKPSDTHLNIRGNRVAARAIYDDLVASGWLTPSG